MLEPSAKLPWLGIILTAAFLVRLAAAFAVQQWVERTPGRLCLIEGDAEGYWELGRKLARGDDYSLYDPPRRVMRMPGFPMLLAAGIEVFGERVPWLRIVLAAVGTAACGLVYGLAHELFGRTIAVPAGLCAALLPTFVIFSVLLLSETLFATTLLVSLIALAKLAKSDLAVVPFRRVASLALIAGLSVGMATLVRPTWLLIGPGFVVVQMLTATDRRRAALCGVVLLVSLGAALLPWTIRNTQATGHFVPTTLWVGPSLYDGLNPKATGASDMRFVEADGLYGRLTEYDADRHYRRAAIEFARANPGRVLQLAAVKLWRFWNPVPNAEQFGHWALACGVALFTLPLLALAVLGGWRVRHSIWCWLIPAGPVLYFSVVHAVFVGSLRYRLPAEYPLVVLSAVGWCALTARRRQDPEFAVPDPKAEREAQPAKER